MIITKINITNYRSCLRTTFSPNSHLSVLIGPNGTGKTNVLNAILLLKKLTDEKLPLFPSDDTPSTAECILKVWFKIKERKAILTAKIQIYTDENNKDVVVSSKQQWDLHDFTKTAKKFTIPFWLIKYIHKDKVISRNLIRHLLWNKTHERKSLLNIPESVLEALSEISKHISQMRYYSASQFTNPTNCPISFEIEKEGSKRRGFRLHGHSKFLFDLYTEYKANSKGYSQFFNIIGPKGIGLVDSIAFKDILTSSIYYSVRSGGKVKKRKRDKILIIPQFSIGKHKLSPNQLSEGTFKTITLLFYLITEDSSILLIEEPEVCVHHGLLSSILELIKTYSHEKQIVISTHSDFVLDKVKPENVHSILLSPEKGTQVRHITKTMSRKELKALHEYLETEGNLGEYWRHGALEE